MRVLFLVASVASATSLGAADPLPPKRETQAFEVPYRLTDTKHVLVRAKLNGKGPFNFILDTGAPAVFIPNAIAKKIGLKLDEKGWGTFDRFELEGGVPVEKARCRVEDLFQLEGMNGLGLAGVELHGVIGANVLAKFKITYDFTAAKLPFVPLDFTPPEPKGMGGKGGGQGGLEAVGPLMKVLAGFMGVKPSFEIKTGGFLGLDAEQKKDGVFVTTVFNEGPADKAGVKVGDKIALLGKSSVDDLGDLKRALAKTYSGNSLPVEIVRDGKTQKLSVKLGGGL